MTLDDLVARPGAWMTAESKARIIVSSRIRLARNLSGLAFPGWAGPEECIRIQESLWRVLREVPLLQPSITVDMADATAADRDLLRERHLLSSELAQKAKGSSLVAREDEVLSVMVNEEDHLRLQAMSPGFAIEDLWALVNQLDSAIEERVTYAFSDGVGYLTACPTNVGTGLRASVMAHLPGLRLINEIEPVVRGLVKIGLAVRGLLGEGTDAIGNMFQISNQTTLGESEPVIIRRLEQIVSEVEAHEVNARARLMEQRESRVRDYIGRAYGILSNACVLSSNESLEMLSALRLGIEIGIVRGVDIGDVSRLVVATQPGHLQKILGRGLSPEERDEARARMIGEAVRRATIK